MTNIRFRACATVLIQVPNSLLGWPRDTSARLATAVKVVRAAAEVILNEHNAVDGTLQEFGLCFDGVFQGVKIRHVVLAGLSDEQVRARAAAIMRSLYHRLEVDPAACGTSGDHAAERHHADEYPSDLVIVDIVAVGAEAAPAA
jgi:hypothetical protein